MRVRFVGNQLINDFEIPVMSEEKLTQECLKNVEYSLKIIEIIKYTLENLGYELLCINYQYRKSSLFNSLECTIAHSEEYKKTKEKKGYKKVAEDENLIIGKYIKDFHSRATRWEVQRKLRRQRYQRKKT